MSTIQVRPFLFEYGLVSELVLIILRDRENKMVKYTVYGPDKSIWSLESIWSFSKFIRSHPMNLENKRSSC